MQKVTKLFLICCVFWTLPIYGSELANSSISKLPVSPGILNPEVINRISEKVMLARYEGRAVTRINAEEMPQHNNRERGWVKRHPILFGTILGFGGGFVIGYAVGPSATTNVDKEISACLFGAIGAGIGALIGKAVSD